MELITEHLSKSKAERQAHLDLSSPCLEHGGGSTNHKGVLAQYLDTEIGMGYKVNLCHACNNEKCSNPQHLYWGTPSENAYDAIECGARLSFWGYSVAKYGYEQACEMNRKTNKSNGGKALKGKSKSPEHCKKVADSLRKRIEDKVILLQTANIDFSKFGWVEKASDVLKICPQKVKGWMKRNCPHLLERAFIRSGARGGVRTHNPVKDDES